MGALLLCAKTGDTFTQINKSEIKLLTGIRYDLLLFCSGVLYGVQVFPQGSVLPRALLEFFIRDILVLPRRKFPSERYQVTYPS